MVNPVALTNRSLRILHGVTGAAGQPFTISRAQRRQGAVADCVLIGRSAYGYEADYHLELGADPFADMSRFLSQVVDEYDVFHFYYRPLFFFDSKRVAFPTALDLLLLRAAGKTVIVHYRGSEVRTAERFRAFSPYNYVDENPSGIFSKFPQRTVDTMRSFARAVANAVLVPDEELQSYVPEAEIVRRAVDLGDLPYVGVGAKRLREPLVVHAPSRPVVKGTEYVLDAVRALEAEGIPFQFRRIEGMPNNQARRIYADASIIVDQLRIGWYGVLAIEGMALGKAVISYVREDLLDALPEPRPLRVADPTSLTESLRQLLSDHDAVRELGQVGREFVERFHDADQIAADLLGLYQRDEVQSRAVDVDACLTFMAEQQFDTKQAYRKTFSRSSPVSARGVLMRRVVQFLDAGKTDGYGMAMRRSVDVVRRSLSG